MMPTRADSLLQIDIERLAVPGIVIGQRLISPGDESALMRDEVFHSPLASSSRRRHSSHCGAGPSLQDWV
jgi:hypothetical protein